MHRSENWAVAVFELEPSDIRKSLIELSDFLAAIPEVKSYHFLVRGREDNRPVISLRVFRAKEDTIPVKEKLEAKLKELRAQRVEIDPLQPSQFWMNYNQWTPFSAEKIANRGGEEGWKIFCDILHKMTLFAIDLAKRNWFDGTQRQEIAHLMVWTLGCTEACWASVGYIDRVENKAYPYSG